MDNHELLPQDDVWDAAALLAPSRTPTKSGANMLNGLDKTPRHAHGDVKSAQTTPTTPPTATGHDVSSNERQGSPSSSPNAEAVLAALQRCSIAAAERRRLRSITSNEAHDYHGYRQRSAAVPTAVPHPPPAPSAYQLHAGFNPSVYGFNVGLPASVNLPNTPLARPRQTVRTTPSTGGSSRDKVVFTRKPTVKSSQRSQGSPGTASSKSNLHNYCRELSAEMNGLDELVRWGTVDFTPTHARRLLTQELQRVETYVSRQEPCRPLRDQLGSGGSVLGTIGQPPLRVPPAVLNRTHRAAPRPEAYIVDDYSDDKSVTGSDSDDSDITSVEADTALEPNEEELEAVANEEPVYSVSTMPEYKLKAYGQSTPAGDVQSSANSSPQSSLGSSTQSSHSKTRLAPILEASQVPELKTKFLNEMPEDLHYLKKIGIPISQSQCAKLFIPKVEGYNFIGRIIGPRGISVRRLENETSCKILIRGRGSVKDGRKESQLRNKDGWQHLTEKLHVLVISSDPDPNRRRQRLDEAVESVRRLLTPQYDEYKRQQLLQLAIINGTYRP
ncbi:unnamed protein product [Bursaphelenchus okinawaensis]|uniref:K Homology domain-containing protein n=1 Tax=Bursaphelenchus okinawaensis TaxID=465554 RepID=A0A811LL27_9BILA|nr:unnamed protein product [Bursaphelenchus okinawaensis]CAG9123445.1 unnamed protein product [Bursaphelenchus okinawaensis]